MQITPIHRCLYNSYQGVNNQPVKNNYQPSFAKSSEDKGYVDNRSFGKKFFDWYFSIDSPKTVAKEQREEAAKIRTLNLNLIEMYDNDEGELVSIAKDLESKGISVALTEGFIEDLYNQYSYTKGVIKIEDKNEHKDLIEKFKDKLDKNGLNVKKYFGRIDELVLDAFKRYVEARKELRRLNPHATEADLDEYCKLIIGDYDEYEGLYDL